MLVNGPGLLLFVDLADYTVVTDCQMYIVCHPADVDVACCR